MKFMATEEEIAEPRAAGRSPIAVLLPCYNEEAAIEAVVSGFRDALPDAAIFVFDNASTDATATRAARAGACVRRESMRGKGNVVRRMFADVDADIYVMADGDGTYDPAHARRLVDRLVSDDLDMVVGARVAAKGAYRRGHAWGNGMFNLFVSLVFNSEFTDMFSGYRAFSKRFVKSFPALSSGFEIETELTVHALELRMPVAEVEVPYARRVAGTTSKLRTIPDGIKIFWAILLLFKEVRPLWFFSIIAAILFGFSLWLGSPLVETWLETGLVPRFPTAILATGIAVFGSLSLTCGFILDSVSRGRRETKRLRYLALPPVSADK
jgi:glycosyltransferase involved in cell wall biosynthesis